MGTDRYYDASKNPGSTAHPAVIPGVPLADLDTATWDGLDAETQASVDASPMYRKTPVPDTKPAKRADAAPTDRSDTGTAGTARHEKEG